MKCTKGLLVLTCIGLLSGCSLFFAKQKTTPAVINETAEQQTLSPIQQQAQTLKTQANSYKEQANQLGVSISTDTRGQFAQALRLKQQGKLSDAKKGLLQLAQQAPNLSGVWLQLALINKQLSEDSSDNNQALITESLGYLNNAVSANQHNYYAHNELAQRLRQQGQFQQALKHYELAIKSWPGFAEAYLNRGILYDLYLGQKQLALQDYQLYQALSEKESRQVTGWIMDLQRQISQMQANPQNKAVE